MSHSHYLIDRKNKLILDVGTINKLFDPNDFATALEDLPTLEVLRERLVKCAEDPKADWWFWSNDRLKEFLSFIERADDVYLIDERDAWDNFVYGVEYAYAEGCPRCGDRLEPDQCGANLSKHGVIEISIETATRDLHRGDRLGAVIPETIGVAKLPSSALFFLFPGDLIVMAPKDMTLEFERKDLFGGYADLIVQTSAPSEPTSLLVLGEFAGDAPGRGIIGHECEQVDGQTMMVTARVESTWRDDFVPGALRRLSHQQMVDKYGPEWLDRFEYFPKRRTPFHVRENGG